MAIIDNSRKPYIQDNDEKQFIGIDLSFSKSDGKEGWFKSTETTIEAVKNNIRLLLLTERGERLMQPTIGLGLRKYLFEQITSDTKNEMEVELTRTFEQLMPFVTIDDIKIDITMMDSIGRNTIGINVSFHITRDPTTLDSVIVSI